MDDCSKHKKEVAGISDMKVLAEMVGDLNYSVLMEFLRQLSNKVEVDSIKDREGGRWKLANSLHLASIEIELSARLISKAWDISKYFMKETDNECAGCGRNVTHCVCP